ncbi:MAG: hypothetical protein M1839_004643 [Geoglossum umbratile]|nr:MAG: hypothetical protein M1839_004643 [Geoglossum umbratile]
MTSLHLRHLFLFALLLAVLSTFVLADELSDDESAANFQILLDSVPEDRLHDVLHDYDPTKFKHGVFQEDRTAIEAVHRNNPAAATKLIYLAKRQSNNTSTTNKPNTTTSSPTTGASSITATQTSNQNTQSLQSTFITSQIVRTSTAPDGSRSTVTEFTVVGNPIESAGTATKNGSPSLQTGAAIRNGGLGAMGGLVGGVVAGILVL